MKQFEKSFKVFPCEHNETINIELIKSQGDTVKDLIESIEIYASDWNGNEVSLDFESLSTKDYDYILSLFESFSIESIIEVIQFHSPKHINEVDQKWTRKLKPGQKPQIGHCAYRIETNGNLTLIATNYDSSD
jgi:hypothetical protein